MKVAGCLLLLAGWAIALAAVILLRSPACGTFVLAGIGVEVLGLTVLARAHFRPRRQQG